MMQSQLSRIMTEVVPILENNLNVKLRDASLGTPRGFENYGERDFLYSIRDPNFIELWKPGI